MYRYIVRLKFANGRNDEFVQGFDVCGYPFSTMYIENAHPYLGETYANRAAINAERAVNWDEYECKRVEICSASVELKR